MNLKILVNKKLLWSIKSYENYFDSSFKYIYDLQNNNKNGDDTSHSYGYETTDDNNVYYFILKDGYYSFNPQLQDLDHCITKFYDDNDNENEIAYYKLNKNYKKIIKFKIQDNNILFLNDNNILDHQKNIMNLSNYLEIETNKEFINKNTFNILIDFFKEFDHFEISISKVTDYEFFDNDLYIIHIKIKNEQYNENKIIKLLPNLIEILNENNIIINKMTLNNNNISLKKNNTSRMISLILFISIIFLIMILIIYLQSKGYLKNILKKN